MSQDLNQDELNALADLLLLSQKAKAREALCIKIGISYYNELGFIYESSDSSFAINLISHLNDVGNTKAICQLCCQELVPIFKGGQRESILKEIAVKLNCPQHFNQSQVPNLNQSQVIRKSPNSPRGITRLGVIIVALIVSFIGIFLYKNFLEMHPDPPSTGVPNPNIEYVKSQGETCPTGYSHVSLSEAVDINNRDKLCNILGEWDIARLANGASMDGKGYGCKVRSDDNRGLGASLCRRS